MPLQSSGSISLANIATEFGGSTPHSLSEYYRGGAFVPNGPTANANIPTSGQIAMNQFYGATKVSIINPLGFNGLTFSSDGTELGSAGTTLTVNADGTWTISDFWLGTASSGDWITPKSGMSNYYIRFTLDSTSGSPSNTFWSTSTGWLQLNANRSISVSVGAPTTSRTRTATYTVQIASDSDGTNILSTSTVTLTASATPAV